MKIIIDSQGRIIGTSDGSSPDALPGTLYIDAPTDFSIESIAEWNFDGQKLVRDAAVVLSLTKGRYKAQIKADAAQQIDALAWRVERAQDRDSLGVAGESVQSVLLMREAIRRAGNRCEAQIDAATTVDAVRAVQLTVTQADQASPARITRLEFLRRFTDAEMQAIVTASNTNAALKAALLKWQTADGIYLNDPATVSGVQALEIAGLIAVGRASQILVF